jgi:hypothetical protein
MRPRQWIRSAANMKTLTVSLLNTLSTASSMVYFLVRRRYLGAHDNFWGILPFILLMIFAVIGNGAILSTYGYYMPWYTLGGLLCLTGGALMYTVDTETSVLLKEIGVVV